MVASLYELVLHFEKEVVIVRNVNPDMYSYFSLLSDCHKAFRIKSDFMDIISSCGIHVQGDDDVNKLFEKYADNPVIKMNCYEKHYALSVIADGPLKFALETESGRKSEPPPFKPFWLKQYEMKEKCNSEKCESSKEKEKIILEVEDSEGNSENDANEFINETVYDDFVFVEERNDGDQTVHKNNTSESPASDFVEVPVTAQSEILVDGDGGTNCNMGSGRNENRGRGKGRVNVSVKGRGRGLARGRGNGRGNFSVRGRGRGLARGRDKGSGNNLESADANGSGITKGTKNGKGKCTESEMSESENEYQFESSDGSDCTKTVGIDELDEISSDSHVHSEVELDEMDIAKDSDGLSNLESEASIDSSSSDSDSAPDQKDHLHGFYNNPFTYNGEGEIQFEIGQCFVDASAFRNALRDYAIKGGYVIRRKKNDGKRVTAICATAGCPWRVHASVIPDGRTFMIKTMASDHTCIRAMGNKNANANSKWVAGKLMDALSADGDMSYDLMRHELVKEWGVEVSQWNLYKAKARARLQNEGSHRDSYKILEEYVKELQRHNPGTFVKFQFGDRLSDNDPKVFKRMFLSFKPIIDGFKAGCRPFIGVDGCHLKGPFGGVLLSAISLDGDKGVIPLAIAIVEIECGASWDFFFDCLKTCIGPEDDETPLTFMSDRQKVLLSEPFILLFFC